MNLKNDVADRLRFLVKERRHVQLGVVDDDLIAAANEIDRLREEGITADKMGDMSKDELLSLYGLVKNEIEYREAGDPKCSAREA